VSEILLNISEVDAGFQEVGCVTVPEMSDRDLFVNAGGLHGVFECDLDAGDGNGIHRGGHEIMGASSRSGENPDGIAMHFIEGSQDFKGSLGQGDITILVAFSLMDVDKHALGVDVLDLEAGSFADAEAEGVDDFQTGAMMRELDTVKNGFDLLPAQDDRQFLFLFRTDELQGSPFPVQGEGVEILDAAE